MTFRADRYPKNWREIAEGIRLRSNNACALCRAPNGTVIERGEGSCVGTYMLEDGQVFDAETGALLGYARGSEYLGRFVKVVLTVAHLDHNESNNDPDNLAALCQMHHLRHDASDNARRRKTRVAAAQETTQPSLFKVTP